MASLMVFITDIKAIGLPTAQGTQFVSGWYWDMNDESRAWATRYFERTKRPPGAGPTAPIPWSFRGRS
jgi:branched-chain amino acid transport system substrate-binding protein